MAVSDATSSETTVLTLSPDNPTHTTITSSSGDALYSVSTEYTKKAAYTNVRNAADEIIGSLEWREVLADKVTIGSNKPVSITDWLKKSKLPFKDYASFADDQGRKYRWKGLAPGSAPVLSSEDDDYTTIIARFSKSRRIYSSSLYPTSPLGTKPEMNGATSMLSLSPTLTDTASISPTLTDATITDTPSAAPQKRTSPATLEMLPRAVEIQDLVVMSLLFLEKGRRSKDRGGFASEGVMYNLVPIGAC